MLAAAAAVAANSGTSLFAADEKPPIKAPSDTLGVAVVGCGGRGSDHLKDFCTRNGCEVLYVLDVDEEHGRRGARLVADKQGREPKVVSDMREAFDDKSVDVVTTATPNHWHALVSIWAMQAGKDVYVEKPVSHNVSEGRRIVETARKYKKICQTGTQSRSNKGMQDAIQFVQEGKIGKLSVSRGLCYKRRPSIGALGEYPIPKGVNYDLWLGPAQWAPLTRPRFHYDWHMQFAYGNGDLGNQGIHQMDLARWGLGVDTLSNSVVSYGGRLGYEDAGETANTQCIIHDYGDKSLVFEVRGLPTDSLHGAKVGVIFEGTEGYVVLSSYDGGAAFDKDGQMVEKFQGGGDHFGNFLGAVRSRKVEDLNADILEGHLSSALCHLGNISYRLGSQIPLAEVLPRLQGYYHAALDFGRFAQHLADNGLPLDSTTIQFGQPLTLDVANERFVDSSPADAMLTREYRAPFVVPAAGAV
jgi:predicted dehydrogenase